MSLALLAGLIGCGGQGGAPTSSQGATASPPSPATVNPAELAAKLVPSGARMLSDPAEPRATVVLFTDYQCPFCAKMDMLISRAVQDYGDRVRIVVRNFPLPSHAKAPLAARAVEAAANQGALSQMAKMVFERQKQWSESSDDVEQIFRGYATELGLDEVRFATDLNSPQIRQRVQRDLDDAGELGLRGTPSVVLDNQLLRVDSSNYSTLRQPIEQALAG